MLLYLFGCFICWICSFPDISCYSYTCAVTQLIVQLEDYSVNKLNRILHYTSGKVILVHLLMLTTIWARFICMCQHLFPHSHVSFTLIGCGWLQALRVAGVRPIMAKRGDRAHPPQTSPLNIFMFQVGIHISPTAASTTLNFSFQWKPSVTVYWSQIIMTMYVLRVKKIWLSFVSLLHIIALQFYLIPSYPSFFYPTTPVEIHSRFFYHSFSFHLFISCFSPQQQGTPTSTGSHPSIRERVQFS